MKIEDKLAKISAEMAKYNTDEDDFCLNCNKTIPEELKKQYMDAMLEYIDSHPENVITSVEDLDRLRNKEK